MFVRHAPGSQGLLDFTEQPPFCQVFWPPYRHLCFRFLTPVRFPYQGIGVIIICWVSVLCFGGILVSVFLIFGAAVLGVRFCLCYFARAACVVSLVGYSNMLFNLSPIYPLHLTAAAAACLSRPLLANNDGKYLSDVV